MKIELRKNHNNVDRLGNLQPSSYESIFNMYQDEGEFFAYNILRTIRFPADLDNEFFFYYQVVGKDTWCRLSFNQYGTIQLWWLICLTNKIMNPVKFPDAGVVLKILKPQYVSEVIDQIKLNI